MAVAYPVGRLIWSQSAALSGAGTTHSGPIDIHDVADLWLAVAVAGTVAGTTPTLTAQLDLYDNAATPNLFPAVLTLTAVTASQLTASGSVGLHVPSTGGIVLPMACQVTWVLGGTTPSFPGATISLFGR
jgi:hypothetical protein